MSIVTAVLEIHKNNNNNNKTLNAFQNKGEKQSFNKVSRQ